MLVIKKRKLEEKNSQTKDKTACEKAPVTTQVPNF